MAAESRNHSGYFLLTGMFSSLFAIVIGARAQDPPTRIADLNYLSGNVSMQPAGADEWAPAVVNRPFTTGDYLWTDADARAELHLNNAVLRLGSQTSLGFLNLDDRMMQLRFSEGELIVRVRRLGEDQSFEVDTPNAAITLLREGEYRFNADPNSATTWVIVRHGDAEITGGGQAFTLRAGNSAQLSGTDQLAYDVENAPQADGFESWAEDRDAREARLRSAHYIPPDVVGYEELDSYGNWRDTPGFGAVWYPAVDASWAPYRYGHWAWIEPWGWTWVDDAPWGFAPCHYGRWAFIGGGWGWVPGPIAIAGGPGVAVVRPVYAPALVAFIGGAGWGASLSFGGPAVGWVPLGPGEVYAPAYHVSQNYFRTVNVSNTTVVNTVNITNVYNTVYVNHIVTNVTVNQRYVNIASPNAVTAMPQNAFASGRPVTQAGLTVPRAQVAQAQNVPVTVAPQVAPVKQALTPTAVNRPAVRPPVRAFNTPVVAKATPPPPPVPFAAKQSMLQQSAGQPVNVQAIRQAVPPRAAASVPPVRVAPPARQVAAPVQPMRTPNAPVYRPPVPANQPQYRPPTAPQPAPHPAETAPPTAPHPAETYPRPVEPPPHPPQAAPRPQPGPYWPAPPPSKPQKEKPQKEQKEEKLRER